MGSFSDYLEDEIIDHIFGNGGASWSPPTSVYLALSKADPTDTGSGLSEPGQNYARKAITFGTASGRAITQNATVTFDQCTGSDWGTITHYALMSAVTAGNVLAYGSLSSSKQIVVGNTPSVTSGEVVVSFNSGAIFTSFANTVLDFAFRNQALSAISIFVGLSTTIPTDGGPNITEPSGNGYARKAHTAWDVASSGATENTGAITFAQASGSWGTVVYTVLFDAITSGNPLFYGDITDQAVASGDTVEFSDGTFDVALS